MNRVILGGDNGVISGLIIYDQVYCKGINCLLACFVAETALHLRIDNLVSSGRVILHLLFSNTGRVFVA